MVVYSYYPDDTRVRREAEALARHGYNVDVICLRGKNESREEVVNGVHVFRLPMETAREGGKLRYVYQYLMFFLLAAFALTVFHIKKRYAVVHTHSLPDFIVFTAFFAKLSGAKVVLDLHESMPDMYLSKFNAKEGVVYRILCFLEKISTDFADAVITVSDYIGNIMAKRGVKKEKFTFLYNVPDLEKFYPPKCTEAKEIVFAGSLNEYQDMFTVLDAIAKLPDFKLHIFGDGILLPKLKERAKKLGLEERVFFHGYIPQKELREKLINSNFSIALCPFVDRRIVHITLGNKVLESPMLGFSVIASDCAKAVKQIFPEDCFYYYRAGDAQSLAERILKAYADGTKRIERIRKAQERIKMLNLTPSEMERRLLELYKRLSKK